MAKQRTSMARRTAGNTRRNGASAPNTDTYTGHVGWFTDLAHKTAHWAGKPATFLICLALVLLWGATGPLFGYSDTWQLVINTSTTIITFLMVFLIQNTQNRDTMALQVKLSELIRAMGGAQNRLAMAEDMTEKELEQLHKEYCALAEQTMGHLETRRGKKGK
jgi:low affinity Fe/Cu permease